MLLNFGVPWFLNTPVMISFQLESNCKYSKMAKSTRLPTANSGSELELTGDRGMYPVPLLLILCCKWENDKNHHTSH